MAVRTCLWELVIGASVHPEGEAHVHEDVEVPGLVRELVVGGGVLHQGNVLLHPDLQPWGKRGAWAWARGALGVRGSAGSAGQSP